MRDSRFFFRLSSVTIFLPVLVGMMLVTMISSCGSGPSSNQLDSRNSESSCDGACASSSLSESDVQLILTQATTAANSLGVSATFAVTDRVGNALAIYQMPGANPSVLISGQIGAAGGLEGLVVPSVLAALSKAGTGAYLSSQGNAFSSRTASFIVQENFAPGQNNAPGGPLFGVQFSQLPCSDVKDPSLGPRPLPLGLSADPGGIPLYKEGDNVGGLGIELDGLYSFDRDIQDYEQNAEEQIALAAANSFQAPENIVAERITVGGQALRFSDVGYEDAAQLLLTESSVPPSQFDLSNLVSVPPFSDGTLKAGQAFGTVASGVVLTTRAGAAAASLVKADGSPRFPTRAGAILPMGLQLAAQEVDALLDSALLTANRSRAAIRRPLNTAARVSIFVVDTEGNPLGFTRSQDAPVFGIDVALQKGRTAAFFSSPDANSRLNAAGFGGYVERTTALFANAFDGSHAFSNRAIGNLTRPFFPDGINGSSPGPLSLPFPGIAPGPSWSPFNTGLQLDLIIAGVAAPLSGVIPSSCSSSDFGNRLANGMQIFSGSVPLYRSGTLIGAIGISGDGIFQDDMIAFLGASREGLDFAGHNGVGDATLGFNAAPEIRSDTIALSVSDNNLRYINCPESPFIDGSDQNICAGL